MTINVRFGWSAQDVNWLHAMVKAKDLRFFKLVVSAWNKAGLYFIGHIVKTQMRGRPGLKVGHGALSGSWYPATEQKPSSHDVIGRITTNSKYARIHQYGGKIVPRRAKALRFISSERVYASSLKTRQSREVRSARTEKTVFARSVRIPKRLHVLEAFRDEGIKIYARELREAMQLFARMWRLGGTTA